MPDFLSTVDGTYDQSSLEISELPWPYIRDVDSVTGYRSDLGVAGDLYILLNAVTIGLIPLDNEYPIVRDMVIEAALNFAEPLSNPAWQNSDNLRVIARKNILKDLMKKAKAIIRAADFSDNISDCMCFHILELLYLFCCFIACSNLSNAKIAGMIIALAKNKVKAGNSSALTGERSFTSTRE
jgi:hypothetical protein